MAFGKGGEATIQRRINKKSEDCLSGGAGKRKKGSWENSESKQENKGFWPENAVSVKEKKKGSHKPGGQTNRSMVLLKRRKKKKEKKKKRKDR